MGASTPASITIAPGLAEVAAAEWDLCANPDPATFDPFVSHAFLALLEAAGTVAPRTGWVPHHVLVRDPDGVLIACAPAYLKAHSRGEYVFDHAWAEAYMRAGGDYYPKLQVAIPFTPVPGRRLLVRAGIEPGPVRAQLLNALMALARQRQASSLHVTFLTRGEWEDLAALGCQRRVGQQYHWHNAGYRTFEEFLATLTARKRKAIRRERREATADAIAIERVSGRAISDEHWSAMYAFYMDTGGRKWGQPYLNRKAFTLLGETMADRILLVMARRAGRLIAGAMNFIGGDCLYGRYWGTIEPHPFLHFELCYHQAIECAIERGLARVEAGAQGEHKLARGYLPVETYSAHWFADRRLARAVEDYLRHERAHIGELNEALAAAGPYRHERQ